MGDNNGSTVSVNLTFTRARAAYRMSSPSFRALQQRRQGVVAVLEVDFLGLGDILKVPYARPVFSLAISSY